MIIFFALMVFKISYGDKRCSRISKAVTTFAEEFLIIEWSSSKSSPFVFLTL